MPSLPVRAISTIWAENAVFFGHWLRRPLAIGAVLPSGRAAARAMARELPARRSGVVLELGGGTGSLTQALLDAGCDAGELIVIERERALAQALRRRFPQLRIVEADARALGSVLADQKIQSLSGVVSSLPIKWFGLAAQRAIVDACLARLTPDAPFLQLTNALASPLPMRALGLDGVEVARVWAQLPPVQIWRYRRTVVGGGSR
jgi:phosphatidylethanolamine/phosphatidyl-N-methylethanolamine N-methyltransferase